MEFYKKHHKTIKLVAGIFLLTVTVLYYVLSQTAGKEIDKENSRLAGEKTISIESEANINASEHSINAEGTETENQSGAGQNEAARIAVDIDGAVKKPAVYLLPPNTRVYQGIDAAGGLSAQADTRDINLAAPLIDGSKLYIPTQGQTSAGFQSSKASADSKSISGDARYRVGPSAATGGCGGSKSGAKININLATAAELEALNGVGPVTAGAIVRFREENGNFGSVEELLNVDGIGEKTLAKLKGEVTIE